MPSRTTSSRSKCRLNSTAGRKAHWLRASEQTSLYWEDSRPPWRRTHTKQQRSPSQSEPGLPIENRFEKKLRSAALTVAVLVIFFIDVLTLTALFWLLLTRLTTLLALFLHVVCHEYPS